MNSKSYILYSLAGIAITGATIAGIEILNSIGFKIPNPAVIYMLAVVFAAFIGGFPAAILCTIITISYAVYFFSSPGMLFHFTPDNFKRVLVLVFTTPAMAIMVSILKSRIEKRNIQLKILNDELRNMVCTDTLTKLKNRNALNEFLDMELLRAFRNGSFISLIMIDIDFFKIINDSHGHNAGDEAIQIVGSEIRKNSRETDMASRYGGDEFVVVCPETDPEGALAVAERIRNSIKNAPCAYGNITVSIGVSTFSNAMTLDKIKASDLFATADVALYASKNAGRDKTTHLECS